MKKDRLARPHTVLQKLCTQLVECSRCPERILFLDVETTGLDSYRDGITVIGWSFGGYARTLVRGMGSEPLREDLARAKFLVTFNGGRFDTKFLVREFPGIVFPRVHIDLMHLCRRVGLTGGQKAIERALGIDLRDDATRIDGATAIVLWRMYTQGDREALRRLIRYNRVDVAAMGAIIDEVIRRMNTRCDLSMSGVRFRDWAAPAGWCTLPSV